MEEFFSRKLKFLFNSRFLLILVLWALLTAININKAYHIDDTFHLEAALWIQDHPATPMSGLINWKNAPTPLYTHNQPPLFFFLLAQVISLTGTGEIPLHLFLSVFTFLALFLFTRLTDILQIKNSRFLLLLFAFNPALVVNQNLMTDVPLLTVVMGSALFLLKAKDNWKTKGYVLSALLVGIGLLIKYSVLPLLVLMALVIVVRRDYRHLWVLLIPLGMLTLWSVWNYFEYGSVHFLDRPKSSFHINRVWSIISVTGSLALFSLSLVHSHKSRSFLGYVLSGVFALFILSIPLVVFVAPPQAYISFIFNMFFEVNGLVVGFILINYLIKNVRIRGFARYLETDDFVITLYIVSIGAFILLFAPFMATRHLLLILPFILLFSAPIIETATKSVNRFSLALTISLGLLLGISDYLFAGYYRKMATRFIPAPGSVIWTAGHWGWQWYTSLNGVKQYETGSVEVKEGDIFVYPAKVAKQEFKENLELEITETLYDKGNVFTFFSGNYKASLYSSSVRVAPWCLSIQPVDTIYVCRVITNLDATK